jgi:hypothetical protein
MLTWQAQSELVEVVNHSHKRDLASLEGALLQMVSCSRSIESYRLPGFVMFGAEHACYIVWRSHACACTALGQVCCMLCVLCSSVSAASQHRLLDYQ